MVNNEVSKLLKTCVVVTAIIVFHAVVTADWFPIPDVIKLIIAVLYAIVYVLLLLFVSWVMMHLVSRWLYSFKTAKRIVADYEVYRQILPRNSSDEHQVIGYRFAYIEPRGFKALIDDHGVFSADEMAVCRSGKEDPGHKAPDQHCKCGFYSLHEPSLLSRYAFEPMRGSKVGHVLLECQYFGTMFQAHNGQRAQRQRVLKCWVPKQCSHKRCKADSIGFAEHEVWSRDEPFYVQLCGRHLPDKNAKTISDIRDLLGTEVEWL